MLVTLNFTEGLVILSNDLLRSTEGTNLNRILGARNLQDSLRARQLEVYSKT